ncbi:putative zinc finger protein [Spinellus fusiger]|nr:putative zinc finger protein [Spinellus fusiger]
MGRLRRSRTHHSIRDNYRKYRTRNYTRDLDQIHEDVKPENAEKLKNQAEDPDKPGLGQNYCIECARHFVTSEALAVHVKGKVHKKRVKHVQEEPYTQAEADAAVGIGKADNGKRGGRALVDVAMEEA